MPFEEPRWWYTDDGQRRRLLAVAGHVAGRLAARRLARQPSWRAPVPVVCIGNFTAGGTGKTPLALLVARMLVAAGERPGFLTRGYGGRHRTAHMVDPAVDTARMVGDEALLLAALAPTCVSPDRVAGARLLLQLASPPTVIVMDDGLQNPSLGKDLVIAVVDGRRGVGNGRVIPAGPLRAPLEAQLATVSAIVVNGAGAGRTAGAEGQAAGGNETDRPAPDVDIAMLLRRRFPGPVLRARAVPSVSLSQLSSGTWIAFAGIGNPERFFELLRQNGCDVVHTVTYPDHHTFTDRDASELLDTANSVQAGLVTTEKDRVRMLGGSGRVTELAQIVRTMPIRLELDEADTSRLDALLRGMLAGHRTRHPEAEGSGGAPPTG